MQKQSLVKTTTAQPAFSNFIATPAVQKKISDIVKGRDGDRFITGLVSAVSTNPGLAECDNFTILSAGLLGETLKLSPSPQLGHFYIVPFNDKKREMKVAQFQLGYKGYIQLATRSGYYKKLNVIAIKEGELISYDPLDEEIKIDFQMGDSRENLPTIGYYAMFEYLNGFRKTMYWSKAKMIAHADKYSQAFSAEGGTIKGYKKVSFADFEKGNYDKKDEWLYSSFWYKDFDGMAYKTMLRQLISKWGIMSIDMQNAFEKDMSFISEDGKANYVDNTNDISELTMIAPPKNEEKENVQEVFEDVDPFNFEKTQEV